MNNLTFENVAVGSNEVVYYYHKSMGCIGHLTKSPFDNCQICTLSSFQAILGFDNKDAKSFLKEIYNQVGKTEVMIDIRQTLCGKLEKLFNKDEIIFKTPYQNNTGSQMCIYLLQFKRFVDRVNLEEREEKAAKDKAELEKSKLAKASAKVKLAGAAVAA